MYATKEKRECAQARMGVYKQNKRKEDGQTKIFFAIAIISLTFSLNESLIAHRQ